MSRSVWKGPFVDPSLIKKVEKLKAQINPTPIKTWSRKSTIIPEFVGISFLIYNGKKFITINVIGARSSKMAKNIGFSIANSPLFKTAIAGEDPNWGRIAMAIGKSGEKVIQNKIQIKIGDYLVAEQSKRVKDYSESDIKKYMKWDSIDIEVNLNIGSEFYTVYTCDFTHDYIDINTDYRN